MQISIEGPSNCFLNQFLDEQTGKVGSHLQAGSLVVGRGISRSTWFRVESLDSGLLSVQLAVVRRVDVRKCGYFRASTNF